MESILYGLLGVFSLILGVAILVLIVKNFYQKKTIAHLTMINESLNVELKRVWETTKEEILDLKGQIGSLKQTEAKLEKKLEIATQELEDVFKQNVEILGLEVRIETLKLRETILEEELRKATRLLEEVSEQKLEIEGRQNENESRILSLEEMIEILQTDLNSARLAKPKRQKLKPTPGPSPRI